MFKLKNSITILTLIAFCLQLSGITVVAQKTSIRNEVSTKKEIDVKDTVPRSKISPDLDEKTNELSYGLRADETQKVIIQLRSDSPLNELPGDAFSEKEHKQLLAEKVQENKANSAILKSDLVERNGRMKKAYDNLGLVSAELPLSEIKELIKSDTVAYISPDHETQSFGHIGNTTGWKNTGISDRGDSNSSTSLIGSGIGVAVIDSGVYGTHDLFKINGSESFKVQSYSFTGQSNVADQYGHGSHVASVLAGDGLLGNSAYEGVANGVTVYSLKVLNAAGTGTSSNVISAINWAITNKSSKNIRVINMSIGTPARDSYITDPLCVAARNAVNAGIVVVASAGNFGKDMFGNKIYGAIGSPGIEPSVITVGATNTYGTDGRNDDTIATFSSRGPTRGYKTVNGVRKYDNLIKPDIVAPGNKIIAAAGANSTLVNLFPSLKTGSSSDSDEQVMYLSGTSMAAPQVAGAAVLLIDTNPNLTPNLIKAILMYSAQPLKNFSTLEQGAGQLNIDGAVRIARLVKSTMPTSNGSALLTGSLPSSQTSSISGQTVYWGKGVITNFGFLYGNDLMVKWQGMYANGVLMSDGTPFSGSTLSKSTSKTSGTLSLYQGAIKNNGVLMSDGTNFLTSNAMGGSPTPTVNSQGVLMSDGVLMADGVLMSDGVIMGDTTFSNQYIFGDNTACMLAQ
jgi:subtilisin family serine protease